ncbi:hypothetical protein [Nocardioides jishulii]|uniref:Uncharacterized protein n=1 Tax=Nocardioides jishulii TaxID=2575440 RepID=A0A4U2YMP4_9ACTN|nr:hypothetical protein [Nocardioides jishulii]QCX27733.1 hypothetical protein FCL41_09490 [Nocardioides jishulii]TKI62539.1 hypothetical protein FC770_09155 [Nocardioides jishulii]
MKIPVVLSAVHVDISPDGHLTVDIDGTPHFSDQALGRGDLQSVLDAITTELGTAVRVEIREADGTTYADIATPPPATETAPKMEVPTPVSQPGLHGHGFHPGEEVVVAYVVCTQTADGAGQTSLHLPPALLGRRGSKLLLVGMTSAAVAKIDQPA